MRLCNTVRVFAPLLVPLTCKHACGLFFFPAGNDERKAPIPQRTWYKAHHHGMCAQFNFDRRAMCFLRTASGAPWPCIVLDRANRAQLTPTPHCFERLGSQAARRAQLNAHPAHSYRQSASSR